MSTLSLDSMLGYLSRSIASFNQNKLLGLLAEVNLRNYLTSIGYAQRVSLGGWIFRNNRSEHFGRRAVVAFPEIVEPDTFYGMSRDLPFPPQGLHAIGTTFHQSGIHAYYCAATINESDNAESISWRTVQLGLPEEQRYNTFPEGIEGFTARIRRHNFLSNHADVSLIPESAVPEEFSKENLRVAFHTRYFAEISDVDGVFWGQQHTYPLEIKEKTAGTDDGIGEYFGLDIGPFVKLAFYAAKRGNLKSLFIVREIDDEQTRNLRQWWFITFEELAQVASWLGLPGGPNMRGGRSTVVRIPKTQFTPLNADTLALL
jgi:hypothetical protein